MTTQNADSKIAIIKIDGSGDDFISLLIGDLKALAVEYRKRKSGNEEKIVHPADVSAEEANGWLIKRPGKKVPGLNAPKNTRTF